MGKFKLKGHTLPGINQKSEGNTDMPDGRSGSSPFQKDEFPGLLPEVEVKMSDHLDERDALAKQAGKGRSGITKKGMEQSVRSQNYKDADKYLAKKGDKEAAKRLKEREARVKKAKERRENK